MWRQHELIYMSALGNCKDQPTWTLGILGFWFFLILFIWLCQVIGVACRIFNLRYSLWHLIPWAGIEPGALAWERGVLATGPARKPLSGTFMCGSSQHVSWHHPFARTQIWEQRLYLSQFWEFLLQDNFPVLFPTHSNNIMYILKSANGKVLQTVHDDNPTWFLLVPTSTWFFSSLSLCL